MNDLLKEIVVWTVLFSLLVSGLVIYRIVTREREKTEIESSDYWSRPLSNLPESMNDSCRLEEFICRKTDSTV